MHRDPCLLDLLFNAKTQFKPKRVLISTDTSLNRSTKKWSRRAMVWGDAPTTPGTSEKGAVLSDLASHGRWVR